jgi:hypothetical protein
MLYRWVIKYRTGDDVDERAFIAPTAADATSMWTLCQGQFFACWSSILDMRCEELPEANVVPRAELTQRATPFGIETTDEVPR